MRLLEGSSLLGRFANPPPILLAGVIALAVAFRLTSLFAVVPGNAPDEIGHMVIALSLSQPELLTLNDEYKYSYYPYAIYNPLAYVPSAILLHAGGWFDGSLNRLSTPLGISDRTTYVARAGMLVWSGVFLFFLVKLARLHLGDDAWLAVGLCGLLPQLTFVQSYVNLDAIGVAAFAMMAWALSIRSLPMIALAVAVVANSKLNFVCTLPLVLVTFAFWYLPRVGEFARKVTLFFMVPALTAVPWYAWNYYANTRRYGSFLGFSALMHIYGVSTPGGMAAFTKEFSISSLHSAFGWFGWMNQFLPAIFLRVWTRLFLAGAATLFLCVLVHRSDKKWRPWHVGLSLVFISNMALHYWASYSNAYQPQGRYIFPAVLIALFYLVLALRWVSANASPILGQSLKYGTLVFFVLAAAFAIPASRPDREFHRFNIEVPPRISQDSDRGTIPDFAKGSYLRQTFAPGDGVLQCLVIPVSTTRRGRVDERLSLSILDDRGDVLREQVRVSAEFAKESSAIFPLHDLRVEAGRTYSLVVRGIGDWSEKGGGITFHRSVEDVYTDGALYLDPQGAPTSFDLTFRVY